MSRTLTLAVVGVLLLPSCRYGREGDTYSARSQGLGGSARLPPVIQSSIVSDFDGFEMGNIYRLANGQIWEQTEPYIWVHIAVMPAVTIWSSYGQFKMKVDGIDHAVGVRLLAGPEAEEITAVGGQRLPGVIESRMVSDFDGFEMGNIYRLANGQIWEQTDPRVRARVRVNPRVTIWRDGSRWKMQVDDIDPAIAVRPLTDFADSPIAQAPTSQPAAPTIAEVLREIIASGEGRLIAHDGTFLGSLGGRFAGDSISNEYGNHGSKYSAESIFNPYGDYGSEYSALSPYNRFTDTPPIIYVAQKPVLYVTVNEQLNPRVHPDVLKAMLER